MTVQRRRGITRGETWVLIVGVGALAVACVIAVWGMVSWLGGFEPVQTAGVPVLVAPFAVALSVGVLMRVLWGQAISMLQGRAGLSLVRVWWCASAGYVVWCVCGSLAGMSVADTWLSPFVGVLAMIWACAVVVFWAVFARRLFTDAAVLRWRWEGSVSDD